MTENNREPHTIKYAHLALKNECNRRRRERRCAVSSKRQSITLCLISWLVFKISLLMTTQAELKVTRLNGGQPIITKSMFTSLGIGTHGNNINGPSVIRVPNWVPVEDLAHPTAKYYMYFGDHSGDYIRMAWATENGLEGPWTIFNAGTNNDPRVNGRGVLDLGYADRIYFSGTSGVIVENHIASPDVIIDDDNQQIIMYFHGVSNVSPPNNSVFDTGRQTTFVATSSNGLNFNNSDNEGRVGGGVGGGDVGHGLKNAILGNAYFRTFTYDGGLYAFSNYGPIWKAPNPNVPWETSTPRSQSWEEALPAEDNPIFADLNLMYDASGPRHEAGNPDPKKGAPRHFATYLRDDGTTLEVWYTNRGDKPERIFYTTIDLTASPSWDTWMSDVTDPETVHTEMLRAEMAWEGANYAPAISVNGSQVGVNQLRDPFLFQDVDGKRYLFYCGSGERAIGIAQVEDVPLPDEDVAESISIVSVSAVDWKDGYPAVLAIDGSLSTRWASNVVGVHFFVELDNIYSLQFVKVSIRKGEFRQAYFELHYSSVGLTAPDEDWTSIGSFETSGTTSDLEAIVFPSSINARYLRLTCNGNSDAGNLGVWSNLQEVEVWGSPVSSADLTALKKLSVLSASSSDEQSGNPGSNAIDGDLSTRWSSNVIGTTITLTLAEAGSVIDRIRVATLNGNWRRTFFDIETSIDGITWVPQPGPQYETSGTTLGLETFDLTDVTANFVKLVGYGNSQSDWTSITEIEIFGYKMAIGS